MYGGRARKPVWCRVMGGLEGQARNFDFDLYAMEKDQ